MATPDIAAIAAYAGAYEKKLFSTLRNSLDILNDITVIPGIKNTLHLTKLTASDGVRGYRANFDADDADLAYSGRSLSVELLKRDILIDPMVKYRSTHMSEVMQPGVNPDDIPYAAYVNEQLSIKIAQEVNDKSYLAKKGDGSSVAKALDGLGTLIASAITAETTQAGTGLVPVATGKITSTNAVSCFEKMTKSMPIAFRKAGFNLYCSYDLFDKYNDDYRERFKKYYEPNEDGVYYVDAMSRKVQLIPCTWMDDSQRIIATPKENLLAGVDSLGDMDKVHTDIVLNTIKWRWIFALGFQIRDLDAIKVNDQA